MFQLYWQGDRAWVLEKLQHVGAGGFKAFCLTVDSAAYSRRERDIVLNAEIQRLRGPLPDTQSGLTWDDVDWVRAQLPLPFGLKGIMTAQDALIALEHGVDFILVGGLSAVVQGAPVTTIDVDIVHSRTEDNLARLGNAVPAVRGPT